MSNSLDITSKRPDDTVLLIQLFTKADLPQIIDRTIERGFHHLKGVPLSLTPLYVHRDDQVSSFSTAFR